MIIDFYKKFILIILSCFISISVFSLGFWTSKASVPSPNRMGAVGFSIGIKGYVGGGQISSNSFTNDFWEWNQSTNVWTQKANIPGSGRADAAGFAIGNKGYLGTGVCYATPPGENDFWEYDPSTHIW